MFKPNQRSQNQTFDHQAENRKPTTLQQAMSDGTYMDFGTATSLLYKVSAVKYRID